MKYTILIALMSIFVFSCNAQDSKVYKVVAPAKYEETINKAKVTIIDVRTPGEYAEGHIKDAKNINVMDANFKDQISKLDKNKPVYIYCRSGARSNRAGKIMEELGFKEVIDLQGGILSWKGTLNK